MKISAALPLAALTLASCASTGAGRDDGPIVSEPYPPTPYFAFPPQEPEDPTRQSASLWDTSPRALLGMRRAKEVGDLLTVVVEMNDQASLQSSLSRSRSSDNDLSVNALFGLPDLAGAALPAGASLSPAIDYGRSSALNGSGTVNRAEQVAFTLGARVVGVEPNGNLIIQGYQQTRVSNEVRYLAVSGVVRTQDITRTNTVSYEKIADANITYVSEGEAIGPVKRGAATKFIDWIVPF